MSDYHGSMTLADGRRVPLSKEYAEAMWKAVQDAQKNRAEAMPDAYSCLSSLCSAKERLRELGWRDAIYCPRDGSTFAVCELGSTGMWSAFYADPYIQYADCVSLPGHHMFFKSMASLTDDERETVTKGDKTVAAEIDRLGKMWSSIELKD